MTAASDVILLHVVAAVDVGWKSGKADKRVREEHRGDHPMNHLNLCTASSIPLFVQLHPRCC